MKNYRTITSFCDVWTMIGAFRLWDHRFGRKTQTLSKSKQIESQFDRVHELFVCLKYLLAWVAMTYELKIDPDILCENIFHILIDSRISIKILVIAGDDGFVWNKFDLKIAKANNSAFLHKKQVQLTVLHSWLGLAVECVKFCKMTTAKISWFVVPLKWWPQVTPFSSL